MSREILDILQKVEDNIIILPFERESDGIVVDGQRFSHQDLMLDIF